MTTLYKTLILASAIGLATVASASETKNSYNGDVYANGGTQVVTSQQANNTWDDWTWRGKWDGMVQYCDSNSSGCAFTWGKQKSVSYSHTTGWSIGGGFGFILSKIFKASVEAVFSSARTWTKSRTENFDMRTEMRPGQWAQPVIVTVRRWKGGHFNGGHFLRTQSGNKYIYDWKWQNFGSWGGNEQQWGYKMIHLVNNRNNL